MNELKKIAARIRDEFNAIRSLFGQPNGIATLDASGKIPAGQATAVYNDTDDLAEGTTNLYYTDARAQSALSADLASKQDASEKSQPNGYASLNGSGKVPASEYDLNDKTTDELPEGVANLYFTDARAQAANTSALSGKQDIAEKAQPNGYASLDAGGLVPLSQLPPLGSAINPSVISLRDALSREWVSFATPAATFSKLDYGNGIWVSGYLNDKLYFSDSHGESWQSLPDLPGSSSVACIHYGGGTWMIGSSNALFRSVDNCQTFTSIPGIAGDVARLSYAGSGIWMMTLTGSQSFRSVDDGLTWSMPTFSPSNPVQVLKAAGSTVIGLRNTSSVTKHVYRSSDSGATFYEMAPLGVGDIRPRDVASDGNGTWVLVASRNFTNENHVIMRSTDDGVTWSLATIIKESDYTNTQFPGFFQVVYNGDGVFTALGYDGVGTEHSHIIRSSDNGQTWRHTKTAPVMMTLSYPPNIYNPAKLVFGEGFNMIAAGDKILRSIA